MQMNSLPICWCRPDVLPPPVMAELAALQDNMPTFPTVEARALIEKELGRTVEEVFSEFGREPVAAASLAQVSSMAGDPCYTCTDANFMTCSEVCRLLLSAMHISAAWLVLCFATKHMTMLF